MTATPFSLRIDTELKVRLDKQAEREERSSSYVVQKALEDYLDAKEYFHEEMLKAEAELDKGEFVSGEAMHAWIESWGTENQLPTPEPVVFPAKLSA